MFVHYLQKSLDKQNITFLIFTISIFFEFKILFLEMNKNTVKKSRGRAGGLGV